MRAWLLTLMLAAGAATYVEAAPVTVGAVTRVARLGASDANGRKNSRHLSDATRF
jgi:hypothetical protein